MADDDLPDCQCGANDWETLFEATHGDSGRRRRSFRCRACESFARAFDGGGEAAIYSGAMR